MRLFVNADDLGMSPAVNEKTFDLLRLGLIDSASIIANAPYAAAAIETAKAHPQCAFGVHLNLTQFKPLTGASALRPLLNRDGDFVHGAIAQAQQAPAFKRAVYREWRAQIEFCTARNLKPAHLDSHHHVHLMRGFIPIVKRLQWRYGIKRVRGIDLAEGYPTETTRSRIRKSAWRSIMRLDGTITSDCVISLLAFKEACEKGELRRFTGHSGEKLVEIMIHPGNAFSPAFAREVELLRSGWLQRIFDSGAHKISRVPRDRRAEAHSPFVKPL